MENDNVFGYYVDLDGYWYHNDEVKIQQNGTSYDITFNGMGELPSTSQVNVYELDLGDVLGV